MFIISHDVPSKLNTCIITFDTVMSLATMKVTFYKSFLCPRCHMAGKHLRKIAAQDPSLEITEIDVTATPLKCLRNGTLAIPALHVEGKILKGVYLSKKQIEDFLKQFNTN